MSTCDSLGGVIHTYQKFDPVNFPSPTAPPPDLVSPAFEHLLFYGNTRRLTEEDAWPGRKVLRAGRDEGDGREHCRADPKVAHTVRHKPSVQVIRLQRPVLGLEVDEQ